jgi:hypothetical protein
VTKEEADKCFHCNAYWWNSIMTRNAHQRPVRAVKRRAA